MVQTSATRRMYLAGEAIKVIDRSESPDKLAGDRPLTGGTELGGRQSNG